MLTEVSSRGGGRRANTRLERKDLAAVGPRSREPPTLRGRVWWRVLGRWVGPRLLPAGMIWMGRSVTCSSPGLSARLGSQGLWDSWCRPWSRVTGRTWQKRCAQSWSSAAASTRTASDARVWPPRTPLCLARQLHSPQSLPRPRPHRLWAGPDMPQRMGRAPTFKPLQCVGTGVPVGNKPALFLSPSQSSIYLLDGEAVGGWGWRGNQRPGPCGEGALCAQMPHSLALFSPTVPGSSCGSSSSWE